MNRLFFAVFPDAPERQALDARVQALHAQLPGARWVAPHRYHLTLHYLGASPTPRPDWVAQARAAAAQWKGEAMDFTLNQLRWLGHPRRPALAFCASVVDAQATQAWDALGQALRRAGLPASAHATFLPHITLAHAAPAPLPAAPGPLHVRAVGYTLVCSHAGEAEYERLGHWPLHG